ELFEGPLLTFAGIGALEVVRLSGIEAMGLRAILVTSLLYYAFRGGPGTAVISAAIIWTYFAVIFSLPGEQVINLSTSGNPLRILFWGVALIVLALFIGGLGVRSRRQVGLLREREVRLTAVMQSMLDGLVITDTSGVIESVNPAAERIFETDATHLVGRPFDSLLVKPLLGGSLDPFPAGAPSGAAGIRSEGSGLRRDGELVPLELSLSVIPLGERRLNAVVVRNISERVRGEEQLRRTLAQLEEQFRAADGARGENRAVLDAAGDAMMLVSPQRRLLSVNRRFLEFFGVREAGLIGSALDDHRSYFGRVFAESDHCVDLLIERATDPFGQFTALALQRWPQPRELALFSTPVRSAAGQFLGRLAVFRDVTREHEADRIKNDFVSLVSHELRTPLTAIHGYLELLLEGEVGEIPDEQREFLQIIRNNSDRLVALVNNLLDLSRIESGRFELHRQPFDLARAARRAVDTLRPQFAGKDQALTVDIPPDLPLVVADAERVAQILLNLLSNAHKYTPAGGNVSVIARVEGAVIRTEVCDSGIGMSPEELAQLYTKFFRARNRTTQEVAGTGLGLAITRSLVEMHGGDITVDSAPGQGSTFSFTLPVAPGEN
ncbi:MAG: ATP-binding protein, partial [Chloroflexi bacterium]|nr:ATP-binding protein [Chloroflexota bacterium]